MSLGLEAIVVGVGGFGSAALYHLARRGVRVLGIERYAPGHDRGSSHGETRVIRKAYFEHPDYVPLLERAYEEWAALEAHSGESLLVRCGLLLGGPAEGEAISGARLAAKRHGLRIEMLDHAAAHARFPGFAFAPGQALLFEPDAGYLHVEACVRTHAALARAHGAHIAEGETVLDWHSDGRSVTVRTDRGEYAAGAAVITAGPWTKSLLPQFPLQILRKLVFWHEVTSDHYDLRKGMPVYLFESAAGVFYGFPSLDGHTLKIAEHSGGQPLDDPSALDRASHPHDIRPIAAFVRATLPGVRPQPVRHSACLYTMSPDEHFIVGAHPEYPNVAIGAGFSGHGFKFTSALGAALADLATQGATSLPIDFLSPTRFSA